MANYRLVKLFMAKIDGSRLRRRPKLVGIYKIPTSVLNKRNVGNLNVRCSYVIRYMPLDGAIFFSRTGNVYRKNLGYSCFELIFFLCFISNRGSLPQYGNTNCYVCIQYTGY